MFTDNFVVLQQLERMAAACAVGALLLAFPYAAQAQTNSHRHHGPHRGNHGPSPRAANTDRSSSGVSRAANGNVAARRAPAGTR